MITLLEKVNFLLFRENMNVLPQTRRGLNILIQRSSMFEVGASK